MSFSNSDPDEPAVLGRNNPSFSESSNNKRSFEEMEDDEIVCTNDSNEQHQN